LGARQNRKARRANTRGAEDTGEWYRRRWSKRTQQDMRTAHYDNKEDDTTGKEKWRSQGQPTKEEKRRATVQDSTNQTRASNCAEDCTTSQNLRIGLGTDNG